MEVLLSNTIIICTYGYPQKEQCLQLRLACAKQPGTVPSINHGFGGRIPRAGTKGILIALGCQQNRKYWEHLVFELAIGPFLDQHSKAS